jgi:hypothetical protein
MYDTPEAYPAHNEAINMMEYETLTAIINQKYGTNSTTLEIRSEFLDIFNRIFEDMLRLHSHEVHKIVWVMVDAYNISEENILRYLNEDNKEKLRNYAINNYETKYYEDIEERNLRQKMEEKGQTFFKHVRTDSLFE